MLVRFRSVLLRYIRTNQPFDVGHHDELDLQQHTGRCDAHRSHLSTSQNNPTEDGNYA